MTTNDRFRERARVVYRALTAVKLYEYARDPEADVTVIADMIRDAERDGAARAIDSCLSELPAFGAENARFAIEKLRRSVLKGEDL